MTIEEFNNMRFCAGMKALVHSKMIGDFEADIATVDFDQALIGIRIGDDEDDQFSWYRCENCDLVEP